MLLQIYRVLLMVVSYSNTYSIKLDFMFEKCKKTATTSILIFIAIHFCLTKYLALLHPCVILTSPTHVSNVAFTHWCQEVCKKISRFYINAPLCFYRCVEEKWIEGWNWIYFDRKSKLTLTRTKCFIFSYFFNFNMILCIKDILSRVYTMMNILLHFASIPFYSKFTSHDSYLEQLV